MNKPRNPTKATSTLWGKKVPNRIRAIKQNSELTAADVASDDHCSRNILPAPEQKFRNTGQTKIWNKLARPKPLRDTRRKGTEAIWEYQRAGYDTEERLSPLNGDFSLIVYCQMIRLILHFIKFMHRKFTQ